MQYLGLLPVVVRVQGLLQLEERLLQLLPVDVVGAGTVHDEQIGQKTISLLTRHRCGIAPEVIARSYMWKVSK